MPAHPFSPSITEDRRSEREWTISIPQRIDEGSLLEGGYFAGLAGLLMAAFLRATDHEQFVPMFTVLSMCFHTGLAWLTRAIWLSFSDRVLILGKEEITLQRRLGGWLSTKRLLTSRVRKVAIRRSSRGGKKAVFFLEITAGNLRLHLGHDLTWEENYRLRIVTEQFLQSLRPIAPSHSREQYPETLTAFSHSRSARQLVA